MKSMKLEIEGQWYILSKGTLWENIKLWLQGYHYHDTMVGWCMLKKEAPEDHKMTEKEMGLTIDKIIAAATEWQWHRDETPGKTGTIEEKKRAVYKLKDDFIKDLREDFLKES